MENALATIPFSACARLQTGIFCRLQAVDSFRQGFYGKAGMRKFPVILLCAANGPVQTRGPWPVNYTKAVRRVRMAG